MQNNILLGQFDYEAVKKMHIKLDGTFTSFDYDPDLTAIKSPFDIPDNIKNGTAQNGKAWVVCAESDKTAVLNAMGYTDIQTVMAAIAGEDLISRNLRGLTDCHYKIALGQGMNEYEAAGYAMDKLSGYLMQTT